MTNSRSAWRTIGWFALAGVVIPGLTCLMLFGARVLAIPTVEVFFFWLFAISYPFWLMLWGVMGHGNNYLLFAQLLATSLCLNAILYGILGLIFIRARKLWIPHASIPSQ
jgi:hypothetical protein